jgi:glyoxylase-like metal-dependent hydrolase (beta-lactamase superfamily II)
MGDAMIGPVGAGLQRVLAPNPSAMTGSGTNSWILGGERLVVIDPGPDLAAHFAALSAALAGRPVEAILVTHAHLDHSALAPALSRATGAPVMAYGGAGAGLSPVMRALAAGGQAGGGEGVDQHFAPDVALQDGMILQLAGLEITAIHTPGHMASHMCFAIGDDLFSGDHVMGWSTTLISPPEGDMGAYIASLHQLQRRSWRRFLPGHGDMIEAPAARLGELLLHRAAREAAILEALARAPSTPEELARQIYVELPANLLGAARRNIFAHLIDLFERNVVTADPDLSGAARFSRN